MRPDCGSWKRCSSWNAVLFTGTRRADQGDGPAGFDVERESRAARHGRDAMNSGTRRPRSGSRRFTGLGKAFGSAGERIADVVSSNSPMRPGAGCAQHLAPDLGQRAGQSRRGTA